MKPNTSNNWKPELDAEDNFKLGLEQGYAKALDDVKKQWAEDDVELFAQWLRQQIAKESK